MRNSYRTKMIAWIVAAIILLCAVPMTSMATVVSPEDYGGLFVVNTYALCNAEYLGEDNKTYSSLSGTVQGKNFTMTLQVQENPDIANLDAQSVMYYVLPDKVGAVTEISSADVNGEYVAEKNMIKFTWNGEKKKSFEAKVSIGAATNVYDLYNIAQIGDKYYRLAKTTIKTDKVLKQNLGKKLTNEADYTMPAYDFTNLKINVDNKEYVYYCDANMSEIAASRKYYTVSFVNIDIVKNKIGAMDGNTPRWLVPEDQRYNDSNYTDSFHANYKITLHEVEYVGDLLSFDINGGTVSDAPKAIEGNAGDVVTLPNLNGTKDGENFIGWMDVKSVYAVVSGRNHRYHEIYKPGTSYTMKPGQNTLYAIYNSTVKTVQFGIRKDGVIQDEPNNYPVNAYIGHFKVDGILKEGHWAIDLNPTKSVNGYYIENDVTACLNWVPSAQEIKAALKKEGNVDFDPETQYIHYYVLKCTGEGVWKVDGVIRDKAKVEVTYNVNAPGTDKTLISNMPGGYQVAFGTEILIGTNKDSDEIKTPSRPGYVFTGWNTREDGTGTKYAAGNYIRLRNNLHLYAQWVAEEEKSITLLSDWPKGKPAPHGTMITLTASLSGFDGMVEGKDYELQWQYSADQENWNDEPGANEITFTYELNATTAQYIWRVVAREPR